MQFEPVDFKQIWKFQSGVLGIKSVMNSAPLRILIAAYFLRYLNCLQTRGYNLNRRVFVQRISAVGDSHNEPDALSPSYIVSNFFTKFVSLESRRYIVATLAATTLLCIPQLLLAPAAMAADGVQQGMAMFRSGDVKGSITAFDAATAKNPRLASVMWQRGLSLYYAGEYAEGSKQFRFDIAANPSDAEEIIWTVMCDSRLVGFETALQNMPLLPKTDRRPVMRTVYDLFRGKTDEKALLDLGNASGKGNSGADYFYSRLYLSLFREAKGDADASKQFMKDAVESYYGQQGTGDYMTAVAKVHLGAR